MAMRQLLLSIVLVFIFVAYVEARWEAPAVVVSGVWGNTYGKFGIELADTETIFPNLSAIVPGNLILIDDMVNWKVLVFGSDGELLQEVYWEDGTLADGTKIKLLPAYAVNDVVRFTRDGNIVVFSGDSGELITPTGDNLNDYDMESLEPGKINSKAVYGSNRFLNTIIYEDLTYSIEENFKITNFTRDKNDYLYTYIGSISIDHNSDTKTPIYRVYRYDKCGKVNSVMKMPVSVYEPYTQAEMNSPSVPPHTPLNEYGPPVIGPDGSVYAYKRTPDTYSILKWEWVDDPSDPKPGPDAPGTFTATPSTTGVYLTWNVSPQDPGCVESYDIERATAPDGTFDLLKTVDKGTVSYDDTSATSGTTWYYRVKARAGEMESDYSQVTSATR